MTLQNIKTGAAVAVGDSVTDHWQETWTVTGWQEPRSAASTGWVYVESEGQKAEYYPQVFGLRFWPRDDRDAEDLAGMTLDGLAAIAESQAIAPGHNPDRLTVADLSPGYRLLDPDEIVSFDAVRQNYNLWLTEIECWDPGSGWDNSDWCGHDRESTYQTQLSRESLAKLRANPQPYPANNNTTQS